METLAHCTRNFTLWLCRWYCLLHSGKFVNPSVFLCVHKVDKFSATYKVLCFVRTGWTICPWTCRLLRRFLRRILFGYDGNHWNILGLWTGELFGRCGVYAEETTYDLLENMLEHCNSAFARRDSYLHTCHTDTSHL